MDYSSGQGLATIRDLDRADHIRADPEALASLMGLRARVLKLDGLMPVTDEVGCLVWGSLADVQPDVELVFLGLDGDRGCFAAVPRAPIRQPHVAATNAFGQLHDSQMPIYAAARSLVDWHARHRFCAECGGKTALAKGGWQRDCTNSDCGAMHFPRTDPVAIMAVERRAEDGTRHLLLGRSASWPGTLFSALAGFIEPGETIEEAVRRETLEEAGVRVGRVRYLSSQAWPFPSQLMVGCLAETTLEQIEVERTLLEAARWFAESEVRDAFAGRSQTLMLPRRHAIAHHLIRSWLEDADAKDQF